MSYVAGYYTAPNGGGGTHLVPVLSSKSSDGPYIGAAGGGTLCLFIGFGCFISNPKGSVSVVALVVAIIATCVVVIAASKYIWNSLKKCRHQAEPNPPVVEIPAPPSPVYGAISPQEYV